MSFLNSTGSIKDPYRNFIALSRYARWIENDQRRETWAETVNRYISFMKSHLLKNYNYSNDELFEEINDAILNHKIMPSMRGLMTAGPALDRDNVAIYNCSTICVDSPRSFDEAMYILMNGTGVGFSVEQKYVDCLPVVSEDFYPTDTVIVVEDSKLGWAKAYKELIALLYQGQVPKWDLSKLRPAGSRLKIFGGRASGPEPLNMLFTFTVKTFQNASGRRLKPIECHDIMCKIGEIVVSGGVRRSALISLSDLSDFEMAKAKSGQWWEDNGQRALANNSAVYNSKPNTSQFLREWRNLYDSKSGERGIFNIDSIRKHIDKYGRRDSSKVVSTNPCAEILLRSNEFCNLTEVVIEDHDTKETLKRKIYLATVLGTWQSTLTNFKYIRKIWKQNCEEERLLGVSLTGIFGNKLTSTNDENLPKLLDEFREYSIEVNKAEAEILGIAQSTAITCVKPSGCRPWDALTTTSAGVLTLQEIFADSGHISGNEWSSFVSPYHALQGSSRSLITKTFDNGKEEVFSIKMSYGMELKSTANHRWFVKERHINNKKTVVNDWIETRNVTNGDVLDINLGVYNSSNEFEFKKLIARSLSMRCDANEITQPDTMSPSIAWLLGYLWGDGAMSPSKYRLRFTDSNIANLEKAQKIIFEEFGLNSNIHNINNKNAHTLDVGNKFLWHWLIKNGVWKYDTDGNIDLIPECVRRSSTESIIAFIAGLIDADGCVVNRKGVERTITLSAADSQFSRHVQDVSAAVGILFGRSHNVSGNNFQKVKSIFLMTMGPDTKIESLNMLVKHSQKMNQESDIPWSPVRRQGSSVRTLGKVQSVSSIGIEETFDIEVDNTHWYYAGAVKSHNTVSQLVGVSSGIHPWYAPYYIRSVRAINTDPLTDFLKDVGIPNEPDFMKPNDTTVFSFPIKAPEGAVVTKDMTAIDHLELWRVYKTHWTEHNPSVTINVKEDEWVEVGAWVFNHFDDIGGISFLPYSEHTYKQAPYQEITKEEYEEMLEQMPKNIDWSRLSEYEIEDTTKGSQELACTSSSGCEIVDIS